MPALDTLEKVMKILDDEPAVATAAVKAADSILDRAGFKPVERISQETIQYTKVYVDFDPKEV